MEANLVGCLKNITDYKQDNDNLIRLGNLSGSTYRPIDSLEEAVNFASTGFPCDPSNESKCEYLVYNSGSDYGYGVRVGAESILLENSDYYTSETDGIHCNDKVYLISSNADRNSRNTKLNIINAKTQVLNSERKNIDSLQRDLLVSKIKLENPSLSEEEATAQANLQLNEIVHGKYINDINALNEQLQRQESEMEKTNSTILGVQTKLENIKNQKTVDKTLLNKNKEKIQNELKIKNQKLLNNQRISKVQEQMSSTLKWVLIIIVVLTILSLLYFGKTIATMF